MLPDEKPTCWIELWGGKPWRVKVHIDSYRLLVQVGPWLKPQDFAFVDEGAARSAATNIAKLTGWEVVEE